MPYNGYEYVEVPKAGDIAERRFKDLDPRRVSRVSLETGMLWLKVRPGNPGEIGPFPIGNYVFEREINDVKGS